MLYSIVEVLNMEAIREIKKVRGHQITVDLPKEFQNSEIEIIILPFKIKRQKVNGHLEVLMTSESSLKKDWDLPQEDKAWQSL